MQQPQAHNRIATIAEPESFITVEAGLAQIERLAELGVLTPAQLEAGRKAGGLQVRIPAGLVAEFERVQPKTATLPEPLPDAQLNPTALSRPALEFLNVAALNPAEEKVELERLACWIDEAGMNSMARLFIATNRPLSFFASQFLLMVQPVSRLALGAKDPTGRYSRLLEKRANLDYLLNRLDELETERRKLKAARRLTKKERK